jgi:hypothetical protein
LALQELELQHAKEEAVASQDFDTAARLRDEQMDLRGRLNLSVQELLRSH